jgi:hypothetical protein
MRQYIAILPFFSILPNVAKPLAFPVFDLGLPIRNKCHES